MAHYDYVKVGAFHNRCPTFFNFSLFLLLLVSSRVVDIPYMLPTFLALLPERGFLYHFQVFFEQCDCMTKVYLPDESCVPCGDIEQHNLIACAVVSSSDSSHPR